MRFNDNSVVTVASNRAGVSPMGNRSRWNHEEKKKKSLKQPACISLYNLSMGGVDRLDQNVSAYKPTIRMKKWYWQLIVFMLSSSVNTLSSFTKEHQPAKTNVPSTFLALSGTLFKFI